MITLKTEYKGQLRNLNTHLPSGNTFITDAPTDNNGKGEAFSPTDTVCVALGSCMFTIMGIMAERKNVSMEGMHIDIEKHMASNPRRIERIVLRIHWPEPPADLKEREKFKNAARTCPVALSLHPDIQQEIHFNF